MHKFVAVFLLGTVLASGEDEVTQLDLEGSELQESTETTGTSVFDPLGLGRFNFNGNVINAPGDGFRASHWMVSFCPDWWEPCQLLAGHFQRHGREWEAKINQDLLGKKLRFGEVNCATDKVLCNEQGVESYPTVIYYKEGQIVGRWAGNGNPSDEKRLRKFVTKTLRESLQPAPKTADVKDDGLTCAIIFEGLRDLLQIQRTIIITPVIFLLAVVWRAASCKLKMPSCSVFDSDETRNCEEATPAEVEITASEKVSCISRRCGVSNCIPGEWALERQSIEL